MTNRIVLIGAGSAQFGFDMLGDIFQSTLLKDVHVVLHDINKKSLERVHKEALKFIDKHNLDVGISASVNRKEALAKADYCVIAIEVGDRFALWEQDRTIPQQYGFRQVFGENGGPGGLFHSLRVTPPILEICADIEVICPDAWVFNYSNPMSRICTTVTRQFPQLKFVGLCHEIASLYQHLPNILETPLSNIAFRAGGLNHFSILAEASYKDTGVDALPEVLEKAASYFEQLPDNGSVMKGLLEGEAGSTPSSEPALREGAKAWAERGLFRELLEKFKVLPITTDSHIGEYVQWAHNVVDHKGIINFYTYYKKWTLRANPKIKETRSERLIKIIEGISLDIPYEESAVNILNNNYIASLPNSIVVEVPALVDGKGIHGIGLETIPIGFAGLLSNQVAVHDLTAEAIIKGSKDMVIQALLVDPVNDQADRVVELVDVMTEMQKEHLAYLK
ncbi:MAG: alpha-galactosidase [Candidatus Azotimanducaceae bacterium]|jgi:alpha-galactosidase